MSLIGRSACIAANINIITLPIQYVTRSVMNALVDNHSISGGDKLVVSPFAPRYCVELAMFS